MRHLLRPTEVQGFFDNKNDPLTQLVSYDIEVIKHLLSYIELLENRIVVRGRCPSCKYQVVLRKDDTIGRHKIYSGTPGKFFYCQGEGVTPAQDSILGAGE